jgi:hypothetical protein
VRPLARRRPARDLGAYVADSIWQNSRVSDEAGDDTAKSEALGLNAGHELDDVIFDLALDLDESSAEPSDQQSHRRGGRPSPWRRSVFVVPARGVAIGGVIVAVVALTALVLVANAENAEALATIALALAILAFVVQILVFIAQAQAAGQQMVQSEQLNTQTSSLLTEVQTTARSTERLVGEQFRDLLKAFVESNEGGKLDMDTFERHLMETLERRMAGREAAQRAESLAARAQLGAQRPVGGRAMSPAQQRRLSRARAFSIFPDEGEGKDALATLKRLATGQRKRLQEYAEDEVRSTQRGAIIGLPLGDTVGEDDQALLDNGLIAKVRASVSRSGALLGRLTDAGRTASRILTATGELPPWLASELPLPPSEDENSSSGTAM